VLVSEINIACLKSPTLASMVAETGFDNTIALRMEVQKLHT
jgi:hypothetical protein